MLFALIFVAVALTCAMFYTKNVMLGFPSAIFWALLGGYSYGLSTTPWVDIYFYLFFVSMFGTTIFTAFGAYGLREKQEKYIDEQGNEHSRRPTETHRSGSNSNNNSSEEASSTQPATKPNTDDDMLPPQSTTPRTRVRRTTKKKGEFDW
jgi:hypothetical protein